MITELLPCVEIDPATTPTASIIWLHGLGADGHDFVDLVPQLGLPASLPVRFVFPHAPVQPITINSGYAMRAWYDIPSLDFGAREDEKGVQTSQKLIEALIEQEHQRGIVYERIVLAGFSQGGAMALHCGLRFSYRLAGVLALSTYLPLAKTLASEANVANKDIPIFMAHGSEDTVIPFTFAQVSSDFLKKLGYQVDFYQYEMAHSVCYEEVKAIGEWLRKLLGGK